MPSPKNRFISGRYELVEIAGEGGMATVWRAIAHGAAGFTRQVAIKKIKPQFQAIQNYINMFVEEARVGSDLEHPHIVQVHDFVIDDRSYYLVMEWVEGMDLGSFVRAFLRGGMRMPWRLLAAVVVDALRGLGAAHERHQPSGQAAPVIHRDVSPQNVLISVNGVTKLTDFGLARARDRVFSLTAPGTVKGKLYYLPPEVTYGQQATATSDVFSMGNVLWESLAGRRLFRGSSDLDTFTKIRECKVPPILEIRPDVPEELGRIIHKALEREPDARFASARDMARALASVLHDTSFRDDLRLELGSAVMQARSAEGLTADWQARAQEERPRWRSHIEMRRAEAAGEPIHGNSAAALIDGKSVEIEFSNVHAADGSSSVDVEFSDPRLGSPPKKT